MPALLNDLKTKGYFKTRIYPADAFNDEPELAEAWEGLYVDVRELTGQESAAMTQDTSKFFEQLPTLIVEHNFYREKDKMASKEEVADALTSSSTVAVHVMTEWANSLPLAKRSAKNSGK